MKMVGKNRTTLNRSVEIQMRRCFRTRLSILRVNRAIQDRSERWMPSEDGWAVGIRSVKLSVDDSTVAPQENGSSLQVWCDKNTGLFPPLPAGERSGVRVFHRDDSAIGSRGLVI